MKKNFSSIPNSDIILLLDNSNSNDIKNRKSSIYKVYKIKFNFKFTSNLADIFESLYINNEFVIFNLYYHLLPTNQNVYVDFYKMEKHYSQYSCEELNSIITRVYKNTGLIFCH